MSGKDDGSLKPGKTVAKTGFETAIALQGAKGPAFAARALDASGRILATSRTVQASGG